MALARAIVEFIAEKIKAKTLFATHYHELTELEGKIPGIVNYSVAVYETSNGVVFLKKIVR
jgi:DNA mismatch repair protein MutS